MDLLSISFIHTADLHLGRMFTGLRHLPKHIYEYVVEGVNRSLENIISTAIEHDVDFVLFVGDVFDSNDVSLRTYLRFRQQLERLERHGIHAFISHGNHDPLVKDRRTVDWPENVTVFTDEAVTASLFTTKTDHTVKLYGFSYMSKEIVIDKSEEYKKIGDADFHIAMLHGNMDGQTGHDPYAPFSVKELRNKGFDYWALGHVHKRQILSQEPPIVYPGNIQGMHRKELGEKGCILVSLSQGMTPVTTFIPTSEIVWHEKEIDITHLEAIASLLEKIQVMKEHLRDDRKHTFLHLRFVGSSILSEQLQSANELDDLVWALNDGEDERQPFVWIVKTDVQTLDDWNREELKKRGDFIGELIATIDTYTDYENAFQPLLNNRHIRTFLHSFSDEEKKALLKQAERLVLTQLMKEHSK